MKLSISIDGVTHVVAPKPGDLVRLERQYDISAVSLDETSKLEHILFLAWVGLHREGVYPGDFEEFLDVADMVDGETPLAPPTPPN
jgi:hypothetical protein